MVKCSKCGVNVEDSFELCPNCGNDLTKVDEEIPGDGGKCSECGSKLNENQKFCPTCGAKVQIDVKTCSNCGKELEEDDEFCPDCGTSANSQLQQASETRYCVECGSKVGVNVNVCPKCGANQDVTFKNPDKNPMVSLVLSIILAGLGHFYIHLNMKGMILLAITLICAILSMFGWVMMVVMSLLIILIKIFSAYDSYYATIALSEGKHVEDKFF